MNVSATHQNWILRGRRRGTEALPTVAAYCVACNLILTNRRRVLRERRAIRSLDIGRLTLIGVEVSTLGMLRPADQVSLCVFKLRRNALQKKT